MQALSRIAMTRARQVRLNCRGRSLLAVMLVLAVNAGTASPARAAAATCVSPRRPADSVTAAGAALRKSIERIVAGAPSGRWSVYIRDLRSGETVSVGGDVVVHPASTIKVGIAVDLMAWLEAHPEVKWTNGPPGQTRSFEQLLAAMLVKSEEGATATLTNFLNSQPGFAANRQLHGWGAACSTVVPRRATAADLALLLKRLYDGELLSPASTDLLLSLMRTPSADDSLRLGGGLPLTARLRLAHKTGTLFQGGLGVVADVGVVTLARGAFVIAAIGNQTDWADFDESMALIGEMARAAYAALGPGERACPERAPLRAPEPDLRPC
jgi:beta-lactamase class A